jgi:hypothetical protein
LPKPLTATRALSDLVNYSMKIQGCRT